MSCCRRDESPGQEPVGFRHRTHGHQLAIGFDTRADGFGTHRASHGTGPRARPGAAAPGGPGQGSLAGRLISIVLAPYDDMGAFSGRIRVAVERMGVGEAAATSLALILHELATNAVKYGALSVPGGRLDISTTSMGDEVMLVWLERGGPAVKEPTEPAGFGSRLIERAVSRQLRGSIEHDWSEGGLIVTLRVSRARLTL